jgi:hypothetical protein
MNGAATFVLCTCVLTHSGCATVLRGTTQKVQVITEPPGARCTLATSAGGEPVVIAATPDEVEVPRSRSRLSLKCNVAGHLEFEDAIARLDNTDEYAQKDAKSANVQVAYGTASLTQIGVAVASPALLPAALLGSPAAGVVLVAGMVVLPAVMLVSGLTDMATGAAYSYPPLIQVVMVPAVFPTQDAKNEFLDAFARRIDAYAEELERHTAAWCRSNCAYLRGEDAELVRAQREHVVRLRAQTRVAGTEAATKAPNQ